MARCCQGVYRTLGTPAAHARCSEQARIERAALLRASFGYLCAHSTTQLQGCAGKRWHSNSTHYFRYIWWRLVLTTQTAAMEVGESINSPSRRNCFDRPGKRVALIYQGHERKRSSPSRDHRRQSAAWLTRITYRLNHSLSG